MAATICGAYPVSFVLEYAYRAGAPTLAFRPVNMCGIEHRDCHALESGEPSRFTGPQETFVYPANTIPPRNNR